MQTADSVREHARGIAGVIDQHDTSAAERGVGVHRRHRINDPSLGDGYAPIARYIAAENRGAGSDRSGRGRGHGRCRTDVGQGDRSGRVIDLHATSVEEHDRVIVQAIECASDARGRDNGEHVADGRGISAREGQRSAQARGARHAEFVVLASGTAVGVDVECAAGGLREGAGDRESPAEATGATWVDGAAAAGNVGSDGARTGSATCSLRVSEPSHRPGECAARADRDYAGVGEITRRDGEIVAALDCQTSADGGQPGQGVGRAASTRVDPGTRPADEYIGRIGGDAAGETSENATVGCLPGAACEGSRAEVRDRSENQCTSGCSEGPAIGKGSVGVADGHRTPGHIGLDGPLVHDLAAGVLVVQQTRFATDHHAGSDRQRARRAAAAAVVDQLVAGAPAEDHDRIAQQRPRRGCVVADVNLAVCRAVGLTQ